ncbi:uncharacterized protein SPAPADRAFT_60559 [Spathaspora passalidarum NRRL Y-27907]|uniref:Uncharacterized protein n=1 Tax=Spathaspora passalidarum (strain NRRL Y-27907 / 11-Y1) TaxID=619300 RepID=G3ALH9_SPAPN|nr:uncharacterized protein SPAPADRAFT_60559 [Spathaspora passalidarum NRRL Y-27907]EGW33222.1 hypothetical protein SPAPADRAFT_60559 [Spathaspora passalidarum NRRL Y-27907]
MLFDKKLCHLHKNRFSYKHVHGSQLHGLNFTKVLAHSKSNLDDLDVRALKLISINRASILSLEK